MKIYPLLKRMFDISFSVLAFIFFAPVMILISIIIYFSSGKPILHKSKRIGISDKEFIMPKFRTMKNNTPIKAIEDIEHPEDLFIPFGKYIRSYCLDELPQLYSILKGDMSFVGPRPVLFNHHNILDERKKLNINNIKPGLTGLAQINSFHSNGTMEKINYDLIYYNKRCFSLDINIVFLTNLYIINKNIFKKKRYFLKKAFFSNN